MSAHPSLIEWSSIRAHWQANVSPNRKLHTIPEMESLQGSGLYTHCVKKERTGPASADQGPSTASQDSYHVHSTLCLNLLTFPYSTLFAGENLSSQNELRQLIPCSQVGWQVYLSSVVPCLVISLPRCHLAYNIVSSIMWMNDTESNLPCIHRAVLDLGLRLNNVYLCEHHH